MSGQKWSFQKALRNPAATYETPEQVLSDPRLDSEGRRAILCNWISRLRDRTASGQPGGRHDLLRRIEDAVARIEADQQEGRWSAALRSGRRRS